MKSAALGKIHTLYPKHDCLHVHTMILSWKRMEMQKEFIANCLASM
jgi:hypothetical protein